MEKKGAMCLDACSKMELQLTRCASKMELQVILIV
uniref:Uncharacterized protein n=1 Tax=Arundo donax TaxID=35708 RepID=A0A0A8Y4F4_ARUDO